MPQTISQAFELPNRDEIQAMGFVVRLSSKATAESATQKKLVDQYVFTPTVRKSLPIILDQMRQVHHRGEEYGRLIQGSFGSGKSHLLTILSLLLENADTAWSRNDPAVQNVLEHREWLGESRLLVVRTHMLGMRGRDMGLDRILYRSFNDALERKGREPFGILNVDGVIAEVRREAEVYGEEVFDKLAAADIVGSREELEELDAEEREDFARAYLELKGRDASSSGLEPVWTDGLHRLADHAKAQGFGGVVFMIDELLLWLAEKTGRQFAQEIHDLNLIVDHPTGRRAVPIFVFVARQRNIREFFPELTSEDAIHEHLDHHAKRFEKTELQDVELRHIVKGRILRPREPARVAAEIEDLVEAHRKLLPTLLQNADVSYLKDVYPFHPALIETLVDVSAAMQRERSALRLLYELLVIHHPDLELGEFLPVGSAFDAIFPAEGIVEASENEARFQEIHRQYHHRLKPAMERLQEEGELDSEGRRMLEQLIKTVLLSEVSQRLKGNGLSVRRLVGLNVADVAGATERLQSSRALAALAALSRRVPELQISGTKADAVVRYTLSTVSLSEFLERARAKVGNSKPAWMRLLLDVLRPMLGLAGKKAFEGYNPPIKGTYRHEWRRTVRAGIVQIGNVRTTGYAEFNAPVGSFRILIDYPWDDGHTVDEDRLRAANARKQNGNQFTVCWLPRHFEKQERELVQELCAVRYLLSDQGKDELLRDLAHSDRQTIVGEADTRRRRLLADLEGVLRRVYADQGEVFPLNDGIDTERPFKDDLGKNLGHFATALLDRRYPSHPSFGAQPGKKALERLLAWLVRANEAGTTSVDFDHETGKVLRHLGQPLELVNLGQQRGLLRLDSRYFREVEKQTHRPKVDWSDVRRHLEETHGLEPPVIDVFLGLLCARGFRPLRARTGEVVEVGIGTTKKESLILERADLLEPAPWGRARDLGEQLFGLEKPSAHRALGEQDRFAGLLHEQGRRRRRTLSELRQQLLALGVGEDAVRLAELKEAFKRLAPLESERTDSYKTLSDLLERWDEDALARLRIIVGRCEKTHGALQDLGVQDRTSLENGRSHPSLGPKVTAHLEKLTKTLSASEHADALTSKKIAEWNDRAHLLVQELIKSTSGADDIETPEDDEPPEDDTRPRKARRLFEARSLNLASKPEVTTFLQDLSAKLEAEDKKRVRVDVTLRPEKDG